MRTISCEQSDSLANKVEGPFQVCFPSRKDHFLPKQDLLLSLSRQEGLGLFSPYRHAVYYFMTADARAPHHSSLLLVSCEKD